MLFLLKMSASNRFKENAWFLCFEYILHLEEKSVLPHRPYMHWHSAEVAIPGGSFQILAPKLLQTEKWKKIIIGSISL